MKRMALIAGIAAALAVPAAASAGNSLQVKPQVSVQVATVQVAKAQVVETQRYQAKRFTLRRVARR